ncbi:class I SAM-dependent methyltransferase [Bacillus suaedaesalsae]|uniref:SAM-dependent methyltransferase n=1 Tax=Bacillus suaedaesalsae TaxID=2810349 RepID=A0ABS2DFM2_9BACI|nr:SAM-dependent methyltransferase [Bacillus suaedaesalsae]MBM6617269.1 SAM-dependent methyltransferase [Bacillus suaedaesalsae]
MAMEYIKQAIQKEKSNSISYSRFMELALYHPVQGYYMKDNIKIGKSGDFYTSSSVSSVFAEILADVFIRLMETGAVKPNVVEFGSGNGTFAKQVLQSWYKKSPDTYIQGSYYIVETSPHHKQLIQKAVGSFHKVTMIGSLEELKQLLPNFDGIVFSNEFFDAFPVDIIQKKNGRLYEVRVTEGKVNELEELLVPLENESIKKFLMEYQIEVNEGYRYEIPLSMCSFIRELGDWVTEGMVFTIDYGYKDEEWLLPFHKDGSLRGYYKHQLIRNPLENVGSMDLTTHIHLDKLVKAGSTSGLEHYATYRQDEYLLKTGILSYLEEHHDTNPFSDKSKKNRAIRSLVMQGGMSSSFHVVIQTKNIKKEDIENVT